MTVRGLWEQCQAQVGGEQTRLSPEEVGFCGQLNKDFPVEIAARIEVVVGCLSAHGGTVLPQLQQVDLWRGEHSINDILFETWQEW